MALEGLCQRLVQTRGCATRKRTLDELHRRCHRPSPRRYRHLDRQRRLQLAHAFVGRSADDSSAYPTRATINFGDQYSEMVDCFPWPSNSRVANSGRAGTNALQWPRGVNIGRACPRGEGTRGQGTERVRIPSTRREM